eukprot:7096144-Alexandrium_andersonii.AAC.1
MVRHRSCGPLGAMCASCSADHGLPMAGCRNFAGSGRCSCSRSPLLRSMTTSPSTRLLTEMHAQTMHPLMLICKGVARLAARMSLQISRRL